MLTLTGRGFHAAANYTCRFGIQGGHAVAIQALSPAVLVDGSALQVPRNNLTQVTCMVPPLASHVSAKVDLLEDGEVLALLNESFRNLTLLQGWDDYSLGDSSGDPTRTDINISGYGFQAWRQYWCKLVDQSSNQVAFEVPAVVLSAQLLQCGRVLQRDVKSPIMLTLTVWVDHEYNVTARNQRIPFTHGGMATKDESAACGGGWTCRISVVPTLPPIENVWKSLQPTAVYARGGQDITIFGSGFDRNGQYRCKFDLNSSDASMTTDPGLAHNMSLNTSEIDSICVRECGETVDGDEAIECMLACAGHWFYLPGQVLNNTAMTCASTRWLDQQALLHVTVWSILLDDGRGHARLRSIPHSGSAISRHILFTAGWETLHSTRHGPASGRTRLHIQGYGFRISRHTTNMSSGAFSVSRGEAPYTLDCNGTCKNCSECMLLGMSNESQFAACKVGCQPTDVTYSCLFSRQATEDRHEWMTTAATASTSRDLLCFTPPWGAEFSSGLVSVLVLENSGGFTRLLPLDPRCAMPEGTSSSCSPTFHFSMTVDEYQGASLSAAGGSNFSLAAWGLKMGADIYAIVRSSDGSYSQTMDRCRVVNATFAACISSPWNFSADDHASIAFVHSGSDVCNATTDAALSCEQRMLDCIANPALCSLPCVRLCVAFNGTSDFSACAERCVRANCTAMSEMPSAHFCFPCTARCAQGQTTSNSQDNHAECVRSCPALSPPGNVTIRIYEVFSEIFNTIGSVWGGTEVFITGWGFRSGGPRYTCTFGNATNHTRADFLSHTQLVCLSPWWPVRQPARRVALTITSHFLASDAIVGDFEYQSATIESAHVSDRVVGHQLFIAGGGFDSERGYACEFTAADPGQIDFVHALAKSGAELERAQVDKSATLARLASLPADTNEACKCPGGCRVLSYGSFSDGSQGSEYGQGLDCYWVLHSSNASSIKLNFSEFDVESPWDHVGIYTCSAANTDLACAGASLFQTLTGNGLPNNSFLVVPSSRVLVTFDTDDLLGAQGFTAHFEPYSRLVQAVYEASDMLSCVTPSWDLSTPSLLFKEQTTHVHVIESERGQPWIGASSHSASAGSRAGRQLEEASLVRFVHINRQPWFWGQDVHVNAYPVERAYSLPKWAGLVSAGVDRHEKLPVVQENDQLLTFELELVSTSTPDLFASAPRISEHGGLDFKIKADQFGEALIRVRLSDNGGSQTFGYPRFQPIPSTVRHFQITAHAPSASAKTVNFAVPSNLTIFEGSGKHVLLDFVKDFSSGVPHPQVSYPL